MPVPNRRLSRSPLNFGGGPGNPQAAITGSSWRTVPTVSAATCASSAARNAGRCRWPLTRRNWPRASIIPAAHQRSAMVPFCQFLTLLEWVRAMEIIDSMLLVERSVRVNVGETPSS